MKYLFIIIFLIPLASSAQTRVHPHGDKLYGNAQKVVTYTYSLFANKNRNRVPDQTCVYTFNKETNDATERCYWGADSLQCRYKCTFSYDENNNLIRVVDYNSIFNNCHGDDHIIISEDTTKSKPDHTTTYTYDSVGKVTQMHVDGVLEETILYKYDTRGNKVEEAIFRGSPYREKTLYKYDTDNFVIEKDFYRNDTLFSKTMLSYDSAHHYLVTNYGCQGSTISRYDNNMKLTEESNGKSSHIKNEYKYDSLGNWVERTFYRHGKKDSYIRRVITYQ